jgi:single-stranded DNA-binding protein
MYNKSDYIPCIAWGRNAVYAGGLSVGTKIRVSGRMQSREYKKRLENGELVTKTAYEVSISRMVE